MSNFSFILDNYKKIRFFNILTHPTHYILYLVSLQIFYKIENINIQIDFNSYYNHKNDKIFIENLFFLPCFYPYKLNECSILDMDFNSEYFDLINK